MRIILNNNGVIVTWSDLCAFRDIEKAKALLRNLTYMHDNGNGAVKRCEAYFREHGANGVVYIILPRSFYSSLSAHAKVTSIRFKAIENAISEIDTSNILYENQEIVANYLLNGPFSRESIMTGKGAVLLNLAAGCGKTFLAGVIAGRLRYRTLYVTKNHALAEQAVEDLTSILPSLKIGIYKPPTKTQLSGKKPMISNDIEIILIHSAVNMADDWFHQWGMVIYDEVHSYCTDAFKVIFRKSQTYVNLGLSATTNDRADGFDIVSHKWSSSTGEVLHASTIPGFYTVNAAFNCSAKIIYYHGPKDKTKNLRHAATDNLFMHYMREQSMGDEYRLAIVLDEIMNLYKWRGPTGQFHTIYVWAEEKAALIAAKTAFESAIIAASGYTDVIKERLTRESILFISGVDFATAREHGRILWSTYGYAGTGISITRGSASVFLESRKSGMIQILGRILRSGSDETIPRIVVDIVDAKTFVSRQLATREVAYRHAGYNFTPTYWTKKWDEPVQPIEDEQENGVQNCGDFVM